MRFLLTALALLAACAAPPPSRSPLEQPASGSAARGGTLVAIRPLSGAPPGAAEFIVRDERGDTIAVVVRDADGFSVGDRVLVNAGPGPRVSRAR